MFIAFRLLIACAALAGGVAAAAPRAEPENSRENAPGAPVFAMIKRQEFWSAYPSSAEMRALAARAERESLASCRCAGHALCELAAITELECAELRRGQEVGTICEARAWAGPIPQSATP